MLIILLLIVLVTNCYELSPLRIVAVTNCRRYELSPFANVTNCRPLRIVACYELSLCLLIILISKKGHESNCQINLSLDYHICICCIVGINEVSGTSKIIISEKNKNSFHGRESIRGHLGHWSETLTT